MENNDGITTEEVVTTKIGAPRVRSERAGKMQAMLIHTVTVLLDDEEVEDVLKGIFEYMGTRGFDLTAEPDVLIEQIARA